MMLEEEYMPEEFDLDNDEDVDYDDWDESEESEFDEEDASIIASFKEKSMGNSTENFE